MDETPRTLEMGHLARRLLRDGARALLDGDSMVAHETLAQARTLTELDEAIESSLMLRLDEGLAGEEARRTAVHLKLITSLNRIGRYGLDMAAWSLFTPALQDPRLRTMADDASEMVGLVLARLVRGSLDGDRLMELEDRLDAAAKALTESASRGAAVGSDGAPAVQLVLAARGLERCGDHACKIAEKLHFALEGDRILYR